MSGQRSRTDSLLHLAGVLPADYLTLAAAAELLGHDSNALLRLADTGALHPCTIAGRLMVPRPEVLGLIDLVGV